MNLVSLALRRPISLLVAVVAVALLGFLALDRMARDIFPDLGVPVLYVAQPYGVLSPPPFGSSHRTILVSLDPDKLRSYNMSPDEVVRALAAGNTVSPSGNVRIGDLWPMVPVNSVVGDVKGLNNIPIRSQGTQTVFIRDVGSVEDGADIQTGYALVDGRRTVYIPVTKRADASTLAVVPAAKANLPPLPSVVPAY